MNLYWYRAKVIDVYDGDTVTVDIDLGFGMWMRGQKVRLHGIDAPELRGDELTEGRESRDYLSLLVLDNVVMLRSYKDKSGKYGRWLADLFLPGDELSVNQRMVADGKATPYQP